jgi:hypothetical protein
MEEVGLTDIQTAYDDLVVELESILKSSCPNEYDANKIRQLFKEDLTKNNLGVRTHLKKEEQIRVDEGKDSGEGNNVDSKVYFYFPISMVLARKA